MNLFHILLHKQNVTVEHWLEMKNSMSNICQGGMLEEKEKVLVNKDTKEHEITKKINNASSDKKKKV